MQGNDSIGEIKIEWNDKYEELSEFYDEYSTTKDKYLAQHDNLLRKNQVVVKPLIDAFNKELGQKSRFNSVISYVENHENEINDIYNNANGMPFAPLDCKELDKLTQSYFAYSHNLFLYYSKKGLDTWKEKNRIYLMKQDIIKIHELDKQIRAERKKV